MSCIQSSELMSCIQSSELMSCIQSSTVSGVQVEDHNNLSLLRASLSILDVMYIKLISFYCQE